MPAVQRAGQRLRPGRADDESRAGRGRVGRQRAEAVEHERPPRRLRDAARPNRLGRAEASRHHLLRAADEAARGRGPPGPADERARLVQRGLPDRRPGARRQRRRHARRRVAGRRSRRSPTSAASPRCAAGGVDPTGGRVAREAAAEADELLTPPIRGTRSGRAGRTSSARSPRVTGRRRRRCPASASPRSSPGSVRTSGRPGGPRPPAPPAGRPGPRARSASSRPATSPAPPRRHTRLLAGAAGTLTRRRRPARRTRRRDRAVGARPVDRRRHRRDPAQHHRRAGARPPEGAGGRPGRPVPRRSAQSAPPARARPDLAWPRGARRPPGRGERRLPAAGAAAALRRVVRRVPVLPGSPPGEHMGLPSRHLTFIVSFDAPLELSRLPDGTRAAHDLRHLARWTAHEPGRDPPRRQPARHPAPGDAGWRARPVRPAGGRAGRAGRRRSTPSGDGSPASCSTGWPPRPTGRPASPRSITCCCERSRPGSSCLRARAARPRRPGSA